MGKLIIDGTVDLSQFWPIGESDADTTKIVLTVLPGAVQPRFSISVCSRRIHGRKTRGQVKGFGRIPQPLHPGTVLHGHGKIQHGFSPLCRHVGGLGEQLVAECLQPVLHGRGGGCDGLPLE